MVDFVVDFFSNTAVVIVQTTIVVVTGYCSPRVHILCHKTISSQCLVTSL